MTACGPGLKKIRNSFQSEDSGRLMTIDLGTIVPGQPHANRAGTTLSPFAIRWRHSRRLLLTLSPTRPQKSPMSCGRRDFQRTPHACTFEQQWSRQRSGGIRRWRPAQVASNPGKYAGRDESEHRQRYGDNGAPNFADHSQCPILIKPSALRAPLQCRCAFRISRCGLRARSRRVRMARSSSARCS
jgi:hypothetical protein